MKKHIAFLVLLGLNLYQHIFYVYGTLDHETKTRYKKESRRYERMAAYNGDEEDSKDVFFSTTTARAYPKGGKLGYQRNGQFIKVRIKEIVERMANGSKVLRQGLAKEIFQVVEIEKYSRYTTKSSYININKQLEDSQSQVRMEWIMFKEAYNITGEDGNIYSLVKHGLKSTMKVFWENQEARYLDIVLSIQCGHTGETRIQPEKSSSVRRVLSTNDQSRFWVGDSARRSPADTYKVCSNSRMTLSNFYLSKGNNLELDAAYPKLRKLKLLKGNAEIVLQFQGSSIVYDMTVESGDDIVDIKQRALDRFMKNGPSPMQQIVDDNTYTGRSAGISSISVFYSCLQLVYCSTIIMMFV